MARAFLLPTLAVVAVALGGCGGGMSVGGFGGDSTPPPPVQPASAPPAPGIGPEDLVGRWGLAAYHKDADRNRTVAAARSQCSNAYVIGRGQSGGVLMHLPDQPTPTELRTKAGSDGKRYLGPDGPAPDSVDREIVAFDGRILTLRYIDQEISGRYGTMVYVRCAPRA